MRSGVGFTGTRRPSDAQSEALSGLLWALHRAALLDSTLRHGNCKGADEKAHMAALSQQTPWWVEIHPGPQTAWDAGDLPMRKPHGGKVHPRRPFLERNKTIIDGAQLCLAVVDGPERARSGTWSTVRWARKTNVASVILWPDASVSLELGTHGWIEPVLMACVKWASLAMKEAA